ncbi:hypothetical protein TNCV_3079011 [Trichonephila clavipes]|nr:hypothetical protein TNCV_3079011 [Trichonephila clavipes]
MQEKCNRLVPGPDYMVDALKLPNQAPRISASNGPVVDSRDLNLVFGHTEATPNKLFLYQIRSRTFLAFSPGLATV